MAKKTGLGKKAGLAKKAKRAAKATLASKAQLAKKPRFPEDLNIPKRWRRQASEKSSLARRTPMDSDSGPAPDKYEKRSTEAVEYLRGNVRWTLVAFGAIGTTLLAGSQLSNIGKFGGGELRLWIAVAFALFALGAAAYAVRSALSPGVAYTGDVDIYDLKQADTDLFRNSTPPHARGVRHHRKSAASLRKINSGSV